MGRQVFIGLISFLTSMMPLVLMAQHDDVIFQRFSIQQGLAHNNVVSIIQDKKGFIWIATQEGLDRYDGYTFRHFQHSHKDTSSLSRNQLRTVLEDSKGFIWVGTSGGGLNRLDPLKEKFHKSN